MSENETRKTADLLEELLKREDPALVGMKKILRKRKGQASGTSPFQSHTPEVFNTETKEKAIDNSTIFSDEEKHVIEVDKDLLDLRAQLENAETEKQKAVEEAYAAGVEEGQRVQAENDQIEFDKAINELNGAAQEAFLELIQRDMQERENYFASLTDDLLRVVFATARQVIHTEIQQDPSIVERVVRRAVFYIAERRGMEVRVNPIDRDIVQNMISTFQDDGERFVAASVSADGSIEQGGCVIETNAGIVDAQIGRQLEEIETEVTRIWKDMTSQQDVSSEVGTDQVQQQMMQEQSQQQMLQEQAEQKMLQEQTQQQMLQEQAEQKMLQEQTQQQMLQEQAEQKLLQEQAEQQILQQQSQQQAAQEDENGGFQEMTPLEMFQEQAPNEMNEQGNLDATTEL